MEKTHSRGSGVIFSRMYSCVMELLGDLSRQGQYNGRVKTGQARQGQDHARARGDSGWGWQSRLGLDAEQRHVSRNQDSCKEALEQTQDRTRPE